MLIRTVGKRHFPIGLALIFILGGTLLLQACSGGGRIEVSQLALQKTPAGVAGSVNEGTMSLEEGLSHLKGDMSSACLDDERCSKEPGKPMLTLDSIANALLDIQKGDQVGNLAVLMGINDLPRTGTADGDLDALFEALLRDRIYTADDPRADDQVQRRADILLIRYLVLHRLRVQSTSDQVALFDSAEEYFRKRVAMNLERAIFIVAQAQQRSLQSLKTEVLAAKKDVPSAVVERATQVMGDYGGLEALLSELPSSDAVVLDTFSAATQLASFKRVSPGDALFVPRQGQRAFHRFLVAWLRQPLDTEKPRGLTLRQLGNALDHAHATIELYRSTEPFTEETKAAVALLNDAVSTVNAAFDKDPRYYDSLTFDEWVGVLDARFSIVARPYRQALTENRAKIDRALGTVREVPSPFKTRFNQEHPYTSIYFNRAMIELGWLGQTAKLVDQKLGNGEKLAAWQQFESELETQIQSGWGASAPTAAECDAVAAQKAPAGGESEKTSVTRQRMRCYLWSFYRVEARRYFLEEDTARSGEVARRYDRAGVEDQRIVLYKELVHELERALAIRFRDRVADDLRFVKEDFREVCRVSPDPRVRSICELDQEKVSMSRPDRAKLDLVYNLPLDIEPGVYELAATTTIDAPRISFHPLALIRARQAVNGASAEDTARTRTGVQLIAKELNDPWVDVSGDTQPGKRDNEGHDPEPPKGHRPVGNQYVCQIANADDNAIIRITKDQNAVRAMKCDMNISGFDNPGTCGDAYRNRGPSYYPANREDFKLCDMVESPGDAPAAPVQAARGSAAGTIDVIVPYAGNRGFPLLVAMGGDGERGYVGGDSPDCNQPKLYQIDWSALFGGSLECRVNDCKVIWHGTWLPRDGDDGAQARWSHYGVDNAPATEYPMTAAGKGGMGGVAGAANKIHFQILDTPHEAPSKRPAHMNTFFVAAGRPGDQGLGGACGPSGSTGKSNPGDVTPPLAEPGNFSLVSFE